MVTGVVELRSVSEDLLALDDITVRFGGITALAGVSLSVGRGEVCGLIGPNGAGKTTLFDVASGVRRPEHGRVVMDGEDVSTFGPAKRSWRGLRRTFQRVQTFGWLTVEDNVLAATEWRGGGGGLLADLVWSPPRRRRERERRALVDAALERCGLTEVRGEYAGSLPIGIAPDGRVRSGDGRGATRPAARRAGVRPRRDEAARLGEQIHAVRAEPGARSCSSSTTPGSSCSTATGSSCSSGGGAGRRVARRDPGRPGRAIRLPR